MGFVFVRECFLSFKYWVYIWISSCSFFGVGRYLCVWIYVVFYVLSFFEFYLIFWLFWLRWLKLEACYRYLYLFIGGFLGFLYLVDRLCVFNFRSIIFIVILELGSMAVLIFLLYVLILIRSFLVGRMLRFLWVLDM